MTELEMSDRRTILILSSNPKGTNPLRLGEEIREIKEGLKRSKYRDLFQIETADAVRVGDIQRAMLDYEPNIVHFCGHGAGEDGLVFEDVTGQIKLVSAEALASLFSLFADRLDCVLLNACYSEVQAKEISRHINSVIGMGQAIGDKAAIAFAVGFYDALGADKGVDFAYKLGCNAIQMQGIPEHLTPKLLTKVSELPPPQMITAVPYVERLPIENNCYQKLLNEGALLRITAPKKMGKTWLVSRVFESLSSQSYRTARLSLKEIDREDLIALETLLSCFCREISRELNLTSQVEEYWEEEKRGNKSKCTSYFQDYLLPDKKSPLVLAIDDVDLLFQYPSVCAEFCSMLRNWHERSKTSRIWTQLRLIVVLSTEEYIKLPDNQSPFNVGTEIKLTEFTLGQIQAFAQYYGLEENAIQLSRWINLVGGHPHLLSLIFSHLNMYPEVNVTDIFAVASTEQGIYSSYLRGFLEMLKHNPDLRKAFKSVVNSTEAVTLETSTGYKLQSMGLIKWQGNQALPSCQLYREYFSDRL
jgi:hypothetical protein